MTNNLQMFRKRLDEILNGSKRLKTTRLANLMTDMEQVYKIPFLNDEEYNRNNPEVIKLYRKASFARDFDRG